LKKPSAAKPPEIVFFIDRSLGKIDVPNALRADGYACQIHDDHFSQTTEDAAWLQAVARHGWVVLTKDERIRFRPLELRALEFAGVRAFIMICGNVRGAQTAEILRKAMPRILKAVTGDRGPFIYHVYKNSTIKRMR
jgi:hypothetical protein